MKIQFSYCENNLGKLIERNICGFIDSIELQKTFVENGDYVLTSLIFNVSGKDYILEKMKDIKIKTNDSWSAIQKKEGFSFEYKATVVKDVEELYEKLKSAF